MLQHNIIKTKLDVGFYFRRVKSQEPLQLLRDGVLSGKLHMLEPVMQNGGLSSSAMPEDSKHPAKTTASHCSAPAGHT